VSGLSERVLRVPACGKLLELAWDLSPLPAPRRVVRRRFADGRELVLDLSDFTQRQMYCGRYEVRETKHVVELLRSGDTFVDVGAHVGWFTSIASTRVGHAGTVLAFEAYPPNVALLRVNAHLNPDGHTTIRNVAVSDSSGVTVVGRQQGSDSGSVTAGPGATDGTVTVPCEPLDALVPPSLAPALVKIDVEGRELNVLNGGHATLARTRALLIEVNALALERNGGSAPALLRRIAELGFTVTHTMTPLGRRLKLVNIPYVNVLAINSDHRAGSA
jgi:FkbM family methyltransferase